MRYERMAAACGVVALYLFATSTSMAADTPSVTCELTNDARARVYRLDQSAGSPRPVWRLSMKERESGENWIRLSLRGAEPQIGEGTAHLSFKNGNGGRQVTLDVTPSRARLDVFVDYGLDVNIEPDLDPDVDRMSTGGPITSLTCRVVPGSPSSAVR
jgi:hypothetical protein